MSWRFLVTLWSYLQQTRSASPETIQTLSSQLWRTAAVSMRRHLILEPFRTPVANVDRMDDVFAVPHADMFYLDLLEAVPRCIPTTVHRPRGNGVVAVNALRSQCKTMFRNKTEPALLWILLDTRSSTCRALLHLNRPPFARSVAVVGSRRSVASTKDAWRYCTSWRTSC